MYPQILIKMQALETFWHFPIMIFVSLILFVIIIWLVLDKKDFNEKKRSIILLSVLVIIIGMAFGKYGANWGLPWWIYYPIPMLMTLILPPVVLKMNMKMTIFYFVLSFSSAPVLHLFFSSFGWYEYMPFLNL